MKIEIDVKLAKRLQKCSNFAGDYHASFEIGRFKEANQNFKDAQELLRLITEAEEGEAADKALLEEMGFEPEAEEEPDE